MKKKPMLETVDCEVLHEEAIFHSHADQVKDGASTVFAEARLSGRIKIGEHLYEIDQVVKVTASKVQRLR